MSISVRDALAPLFKPTLITIVGLVGFLFGWWVNATYYSDRAPEQPINFSHRIHVSENGIECLHCHVYADKTPSAGVPSVNKCIGCHRVIAADKPEILKVFEYWENREPIPWVKVHDVPDFVHFTHKRHIKAGLACEQCHGPIETMDRVTRVSNLRMPWCVDCHTQREVEHGRDCWTCHK